MVSIVHIENMFHIVHIFNHVSMVLYMSLTVRCAPAMAHVHRGTRAEFSAEAGVPRMAWALAGREGRPADW